MKLASGPFGRNWAGSRSGEVQPASLVNKLAAVLAWALLAVIVFVTLSPIELRPRVGPAFIERFSAYLLLGAAFKVGYPQRLPWVVAIVALAAIVPEAGQLFVRGRHARTLDGAEKLAGGAVGIALATFGSALAERVRARLDISTAPDQSA